MELPAFVLPSRASSTHGGPARARTIALLNYAAGSVIIVLALRAARARVAENAAKTVALGGGQPLPAGYQIATEEGEDEDDDFGGGDGGASHFHNSL